MATLDGLPDETRHVLRGGFDASPDAFDRTRPVCPAELFDDLVRLAALRPGERVAEIGCGTGQATVPLAQRGMAVTAVELSAGLAAVARRRLAGFPAANVVTTPFEDWQPPSGAFGAVVAVNSLHWIDPPLRYAKPSRLLKSDGVLVVGGCRLAQPADAGPFWTEVQQDYRAVGFEGSPPPPPEELGRWRFPAEAAPFFTEVAARRYPFQVTYSAADYLAHLATQSGTRALGAVRGADFLSRVRARLESLGSPQLTVTFVGFLTVGRRRENPG
jgi:SAM-dependent methyltransferase